jgi:hypothetical protein
MNRYKLLRHVDDSTRASLLIFSVLKGLSCHIVSCICTATIYLRVRSFIVLICPGTVTELYLTVRKLLWTVPGQSEPVLKKVRTSLGQILDRQVRMRVSWQLVVTKVRVTCVHAQCNIC